MHVPLKVVVGTIAKNLSGNFLIRRRIRVWSAAKSSGDLHLRWLALPPAGRYFVLHFDAGEPCRLEPADEVSLVPPDQRPPPVVLASVLICPHFSPLGLKFVIEPAIPDLSPDSLADLVDGLED